MTVVELITRARRHPLDVRYSILIMGRTMFKPRSKDMEHLLRELQVVQSKRLRRDNKRAA